MAAFKLWTFDSAEVTSCLISNGGAIVQRMNDEDVEELFWNEQR